MQIETIDFIILSQLESSTRENPSFWVIITNFEWSIWLFYWHVLFFILQDHRETTIEMNQT